MKRTPPEPTTRQSRAAVQNAAKPECRIRADGSCVIHDFAACWASKIADQLRETEADNKKLTRDYAALHKDYKWQARLIGSIRGFCQQVVRPEGVSDDLHLDPVAAQHVLEMIAEPAS